MLVSFVSHLSVLSNQDTWYNNLIINERHMSEQLLLLDISSLIEKSSNENQNSNYLSKNVLSIAKSTLEAYGYPYAQAFIRNEDIENESYGMEVEAIEAVLSGLGVNLIKADDPTYLPLIKRCATSHKNGGVIIATYNKKLSQLISDQISFFNFSDFKLLSLNNFEENIGFAPDNYLDYLALKGDSSSGIEQVIPLGENLISQVIDKTSNIDEIINNIVTSGNKILRRVSRDVDVIKSHRESFDIPIISFDISGIDFKRGDIDKEALISHYKRYGLTDWIIEDNLTGGPNSVIVNSASFDAGLKVISKSTGVLINPVFHNSKQIGIGIATKNRESFFIPFVSISGSSFIKESYFYTQCKEFLESNIPKVVINAKSFCKQGLINDVQVKNIVLDPQQAFYTIDSNKYCEDSGINIAKIFEKVKKSPYVTLSNDDFTDIISESSNAPSLEKVSKTIGFQTIELYSMSEKLYLAMKKNEPKVEKYYREYESKLNLIVANMEYKGMPMNGAYLKNLESVIDTRLRTYDNNIKSLVGRDFEVSSESMKAVIFEELKIIPLQNGKKTLTKAVMETFKGKHKLIEIYSERCASQQIKQEINKFYPHIVESDGRIYPEFNHIKIKTFRFSAQKPPVQGFPKKGEAIALRTSVEPVKGNYIVSIDYAQFELKILAHLSQDEILISAFKNNVDIHKLTASQIYNISIEDVTESQRSDAKAINFGLIYGKTAYSLAPDLNVSINEAQTMMKVYFDKFPKVKLFLDSLEKEAVENGFVRTLLGRKISIPEAQSHNENEANSGKRKAKNAPMQGTAAELIKIAMVNVCDLISNNYPEIYLINQVHDELIFETPKELVKEFSEKARLIMENIIQLRVPLNCDVEIGSSWGKAKGITLENSIEVNCHNI